MKKIPYYIILFFSLISCEDVIDVDLPETESRLVVNAVLRVDVSQEFVPIEIQVAETSSFFEQNEPTQLTSATILYGVPSENDPTLFEEEFSSSLTESAPGSGIYIPDPTFDTDQRIRTASLEPGMVFNLIIEHNDESFFASTTYITAPPIDNVEQGTAILFSDDDTEVLVTFTDIPGVENHYIFDFDFNEFLVLDDQFIDGQQFEFSYFYDQNLVAGDFVEISILGADLEFFNYMNLIIEQTESNGGVFQTPVATVRGNIFNTTGIDNEEVFDNSARQQSFPLGYFAVVQEFKDFIIIE